jgi:uncharacterized damage-inducible protein DinB
MPELADGIGSELTAYYEKIAAELHKWVDPLSTEQFWRNPYGYGNSVGHLVLHLTGNLNYYIGARIAGTGYVRNRDREFTETQRPPKDQVLEGFDRAISMVVATIHDQLAGDWMAGYSAEREPHTKNRFGVFLRCAGHAYHHVGQIIFLSKELTREAGPRGVSA